jgi:hypothetical protein
MNFLTKIELEAACEYAVNEIDNEKNTIFRNIKFDSPCHLKKIKLASHLQNKCYKIEKKISDDRFLTLLIVCQISTSSAKSF